MLCSLYIENIAVAKQLNLELGEGLTVITGETGAGKSVLIDSLGLLCGWKAQRELLRTGETRAMVSAVFSDVSNIPALSEMGIEPDENGEIEIQRVLTADGHSSVKVNRRGVPLSLLKEIVPPLLSIQSQNESRNLLDKKFHLEMLDSFAKTDSAIEDYKSEYVKFVACRNSLEELRDSLRQRNMLSDILKYQLKEIEGAKLSDPQEDEKLQALRIKLKNIERIQKYSGFVYHALAQNEKGTSVAVLLQKSAAALRQLADVMPEAEQLATRLDNYRYEIADIGETAYALTDDSEVTDPEAQLNAIETRLSQIERLKRKYGESIAEIIAFRRDCAAKLAAMDAGEERIAEIESEMAAIKRVLAKKAAALSQMRRDASEKLSRDVCATLAYLDMPKVRFLVEVCRQFDASGAEVFGTHGSDDVTFLIATNPGEPPMPLGKIASGGEMSRIMLALRSVMNKQSGASTVVFDEIDAGVSGSTAERIGIKLKEIAKSVQVICVTHSPQIAALADTHMRISKSVNDGRAESAVEVLTDDGRVAEIARIIGGISVTDTQRDVAREMISNNTNETTIQ